MAKGNFTKCLAVVLKHEGGFVNNRRDPGGATKYGITRRVLRRWRGTPVSVADVRRLRKREAAGIYRWWYWRPVWGDDLPAGVDLVVFDYAVNSGWKRAVKALQRSAGARADGYVGPKTLAAVRRAGAKRVIRRLSARRLGWLHRLRTWRWFGRGWSRRVRDTEIAALKMASRT
jgi:lysozyme family protein